MKAETIKTYQRRIASANKSELIVILYDIIIENLSLAKKAGEKGGKEEMRKRLRKAEAFVKELLSSLDTGYEISLRLASLYLFVNRQINFSIISGRQEEIAVATELLKKLRLSFDTLAKEDKSPPLMQNTEQLFAGFTYAKDSGLTETALDEASMKRGYRI